MEFVAWFEQIDKDSLNLAGGKGANLGELRKIKMPVPPGFVITTKAFDKFIELNGIKNQIQAFIEACDVDNTEQLLETSKKIKNLIISQDFPVGMRTELIEAYRELSFAEEIITPKALELIAAGRDYALVAVRSSATAEDLPQASFAGQQATFLNVKGIKDYLESVKKCWASLYEPRAIFYRAKHNIKHASIAVVVQKMVSSDVSGVMFTVNPVTGEDEIVIEATWGLGETLVAGEVEPDFYRVSKDGRILEKKIGKKEKMRVRDLATDRTVVLPVAEKKVNAQVMSDEQILQLAEYGKAIEKHYGKAQDIEFAIERGRIFILQTRAVTAVGKKEEVKIEGEVLVKGLAVSPGIASGKVKIVRSLQDITKVEKGDILVTEMTTPDLVPTMSKCAAIVTDAGGRVCHAAIVSREMGIPCVVGTQTATKVLKDGQEVTVDAYEGVIYAGRIEIKKPEVKVEEELPPLEKLTVTQIKVNLAFPENVEQVAEKVDGVGLLRIEHMITRGGVHPAKLVREGRKEEYIKILLDGIRPIAKAFYPKPVWVRTLDARSDEFRNLEGGEEEPKEDNPMLGWHGIRRSLDEPELLKAEFEAIKRLHEEGLNNVHVMLPFVISVEELRKAKEIAREIGLPESCKIGIMCEVPSCALNIEDFCMEGVDFVSIGSNDLTMLTLGVDRNNAKISNLYSEFHPSVLKLIKHVIKVCNRYGIESSICGESGSDPEMVKLLIKFGIKSISCNIDAIEKVRMAVIRTERELILEFMQTRKNV
ncbi:MAG: phosphoenolpyruvate synthase [Candidatus Aenigmatarchaeota archaeon]